MAVNFTARDLEVFAAAMRSVKGGGNIELDNEKLAVEGKFMNANSARVAWHNLKKKIQKAAPGGDDSDANQNGDGSDAAAPVTPFSGKKRKAAAKTEGETENDESPTKKGKVTPKKGRKARTPAKVAVNDDGASNADGEETATVSPVKKGRKAATKKDSVINAEDDEAAGPEKSTGGDEDRERAGSVEMGVVKQEAQDDNDEA